LFDVFYRSNVRNVELLLAEIRRQRSRELAASGVDRAGPG
jgi:hypothetical protein